MTKDQSLIETMKQFTEGAITATEMLNNIFKLIGNEAEEFWTQFPSLDEEAEAIREVRGYAEGGEE
jgi:hypothetical protein